MDGILAAASATDIGVPAFRIRDQLTGKPRSKQF